MMRDDVYDEESSRMGVGVVSVSGFTDEVKDPNGCYARLKEGNETDVTLIRRPVESISSSVSSSSSSSSFGESARYGSGNCSLLMYIWWWAKLVLLVAALAVLGAVFFKWVGPFIMDKEIIPVINWETGTFNRAELAILVLASVALFPTLFLPSSPAMWVAGMTFGCGYGFLLTIAAVPFGVSLPYFVGSFFHHKIQGLLERYPKRAALIRLAGEGNRFDQFRAVLLIRISPFPYIIFNYCAVATGVEYLPYLLGSLAGMVPEIFLTLYTGIVIKTLADASEDSQYLSVQQIVFNLICFCATVGATAILTLYAKGKLKELKKEEERLLK